MALNPLTLAAGFLKGSPIGAALSLGAALLGSSNSKAKEVGEGLTALFGKGDGALTAQERAQISRQASLERIAQSQNETDRQVSDDKVILGTMEAAVASGSPFLVLVAGIKALARPAASYGAVVVALKFVWSDSIPVDKGPFIVQILIVLAGLAGVSAVGRSIERLKGKA